MAINNQPTIKPRTVTGLFTKYIPKVIPLAFDESMSYYECLCALLDYINKNVIPALDNNAEGLLELQEFYVELQSYVNNYFDNLDVQEEINNKLDAMVEDGVLEQIIEQYLSSSAIWGFDNVASMKEATNLIDGSYAKTLGYHIKNDGGGATYKIRTITNNDVVDEGSIIALNDSTLIAELVSANITPEMFGAYGDGTHNDNTAFNNAINYANKITLAKKTYKITQLLVTSEITIDGNEATIIDNDSVNEFIKIGAENSNFNVYINDLKINCPHSNIGIYDSGSNLLCENVSVSNAIAKNIQIVKVGSYGNCKLNKIFSNSSAIGLQLDATDCFISNYFGYNCMTHIKNNKGLNHFNTVHGWNYNQPNKDWITGSTLIDTRANIVGNDIYIDTLENGIKLPTDYPYVSVLLQNVNYYINTSSYPSTQQAPTLLKNVENFNGYCRIDGFHGDENNWKDSNNNYPILIDNIDTSRISLTNVTNSGFRFGRYKPIETNADIDMSSYTINVDTYVSYSTRKVKYKDYDIHAYFKASMKTSCPNNTILSQITFTGQQLNNLSSKTRVSARFVESSNDGVVYDLSAHIISGRLTIYNNSGIALGSQGHYGDLYVYIDDVHQN